MAPWQKVLASALVGFSSTSLVGAEDQGGQCQGILRRLEAKNDFELQALCRAEFSPGSCRETLRSLGARPWGQEQLQATCQRWLENSPSSDVARVLEEAQSLDDLSTKTTTVTPAAAGARHSGADVDTAVAEKTSTTPSPEKDHADWKAKTNATAGKVGHAAGQAHADWEAAHATAEEAGRAASHAHADWKAKTQEKFALATAAAAAPPSRMGALTAGSCAMAVAAMALFGVSLIVRRLRRQGAMTDCEEDDLLEKQPEIAE